MARYKKSKSEGKYAHTKTEVDGIVFDSKMEADFYKHLKALQEEGSVTHFETQPEYVLQEKFILVDGERFKGSHPLFNKMKKKHNAKTYAAIKYRSDFLVTFADGEQMVIDVKGVETPEFKIKKKMFMYKYPELELMLLTWYNKQWVTLEEKESIKKEKSKTKANKPKSKKSSK